MPFLYTERLNIVKILTHTTLICRLKQSLSKFQEAFLSQANSSIHVEMRMPQNRQRTLEKNKGGELTRLHVKIYSKTTLTEAMWCWHRDGQIDQWESPASRNRHIRLWTTDCAKSVNAFR